jgi:hypothetical protein
MRVPLRSRMIRSGRLEEDCCGSCDDCCIYACVGAGTLTGGVDSLLGNLFVRESGSCMIGCCGSPAMVLIGRTFWQESAGFIGGGKKGGAAPSRPWPIQGMLCAMAKKLFMSIMFCGRPLNGLWGTWSGLDGIGGWRCGMRLRLPRDR